MSDGSLGYIFGTGASTSDAPQFQHLVTIDAPTVGGVISSCEGRQGMYVLSQVDTLTTHEYTIHVLPLPDKLTDVKYPTAPKMRYRWRSKVFVMPGLTTMAAGKVVHSGGDVRIRIFVDGCCRHEQQVRSNRPFRLPPNMMGVEWEIELIGKGTVYEVHIAPSIQELLGQ